MGICQIARLGMISLLMSALFIPERAMAQAAKLNPYPDVVLAELLSNCLDDTKSLNLIVPLDRNNSISIRSATDKKIANLDKRLKESKDTLEQEAQNAYKQVEAEVKDRQSQLEALVRDPEKFNQQLQKVKEAIAQKTTPDAQLASLKILLKDLEDIQRDPKVIKLKAQESRDRAVQEIRDSQKFSIQQLDQNHTKSKQRLTICTCKIEGLQAKYPVQDFYKQMMKELMGEPAISKDWSEVSQTCKK
jgi:septal ring factor EnvC (AmiA/AmiB activator)